MDDLIIILRSVGLSLNCNLSGIKWNMCVFGVYCVYWVERPKKDGSNRFCNINDWKEK